MGLPECTLATGGTEDCFRVQDQVAQAWINFAATGNPSQEGLEWTPWTEEEMGTMVFDVESRFMPLNDVELCDLLAKHA